MNDAAEYISRLKRKNVKIFTADTVRIGSLELERLLLEAWRAGHQSGLQSRSIFESIFGHKANEL